MSSILALFIDSGGPPPGFIDDLDKWRIDETQAMLEEMLMMRRLRIVETGKSIAELPKKLKTAREGLEAQEGELGTLLNQERDTLAHLAAKSDSQLANWVRDRQQAQTSEVRRALDRTLDRALEEREKKRWEQEGQEWERRRQAWKEREDAWEEWDEWERQWEDWERQWEKQAQKREGEWVEQQGQQLDQDQQQEMDQSQDAEKLKQEEGERKWKELEREWGQREKAWDKDEEDRDRVEQDQDRAEQENDKKQNRLEEQAQQWREQKRQWRKQERDRREKQRQWRKEERQRQEEEHHRRKQEREEEERHRRRQERQRRKQGEKRQQEGKILESQEQQQQWWEDSRRRLEGGQKRREAERQRREGERQRRKEERERRSRELHRQQQKWQQVRERWEKGWEARERERQKEQAEQEEPTPGLRWGLRSKRRVQRQVWDPAVRLENEKAKARGWEQNGLELDLSDERMVVELKDLRLLTQESLPSCIVRVQQWEEQLFQLETERDSLEPNKMQLEYVQAADATSLQLARRDWRKLVLLAESWSPPTDLTSQGWIPLDEKELKKRRHKHRLLDVMMGNHSTFTSQSPNLDALLVFAGLFSAILSAFLIEIRKGLEEDLLLAILQQLQNMPQSFQPTPVSIWVNGLWFTSLAASLTGTLVVMLAKSRGRWTIGGKEAEALFSTPEGLRRRWDEIMRLHIHAGFKQELALLIATASILIYVALILFCSGLSVLLYTTQKTLGISFLTIVSLMGLFILGVALHNISAFYGK